MSIVTFQNESELFGRTIRVNLAKPQKAKEGSSRAVWADDEWLKKYAGASLETEKEGGEEGVKRPAAETVSVFLISCVICKQFIFHSLKHFINSELINLHHHP